MKSITCTVKDEAGIHARPAGLLAKQAGQFKSKIVISNGVKEVDAKKIMGIMTLGVKKDQDVTFTLEGEDEDEAVKAIELFMKENL